MAGNESMNAILIGLLKALTGMKGDMDMLEGKLGKDKEHGKATKAIMAAYKSLGSEAAGLQKKMKG